MNQKPRDVPTRSEWHKTYGGNISYSDFWKPTSMAYVAREIAKDFRFDRKCRKGGER